MAIPKFFKNVSGQITEASVGIDQSTGASDGHKVVVTDPATGKLHNSFMPTGIGADTQIIVASEALSAGDLVNIWESSGAKVRKADASNNYEAHGFVKVGVLSGANAEVYFEGTNDGLTGANLTAGKQYLSVTVAGKTQATPPTTSGHIVQCVGFATSATSFNFQSQLHFRLA